MRIPLDSVDAIIDDPGGFIEQIEAEDGTPAYSRPGRNFYMQNALLKWHKGDLTLDAARKEIETKCDRFKNRVMSDRALKKFDRYVEDYQSMQAVTRFTRMKVVVPLPKGVDRRFEVSGVVRRLDKEPDGTYTAWLFARGQHEGPDLVRLPLFQDAVANRLNLELDEIRIGVYCFADGSKRVYHFDGAEIEAARDDLHKLLMELAPLAEREPQSAQAELDFGD